jgi:AcrR family transcriptional regulator
MTTDVALEAGVARPLRADARRNFDSLVAAARDTFAEQGTSASLEEIARRAEVGIGTLYRHFPARDALVEAVYVDEVARMVSDAEQIAGREPWEALDLWLRRLVTYVSAKRVLVEGLNRESQVLVNCRAILYGSGRPILERAQQAGVARADVKVEDAMRLVQGLAAVAFPTEAERDHVVGLAIDGLRAAR